MKKSTHPPLPYIGELLEFVIRAFSVIDDQNEPALKKAVHRLNFGTVISPENAKRLLKKQLKPLIDCPEFGLEIFEGIGLLLDDYARMVLWLDCHNLPAQEVRALLTREVVPHLCFVFPARALLELHIDPCDWLATPEKTVSDVWKRYLGTRDISIPKLAKELSPKFAAKHFITENKSIEDNLYRWQKDGSMNVRSILQFLEIGYEPLAVALLFANAFQRFWTDQSEETRKAALPNWKQAYDHGPVFSAEQLQGHLSDLARTTHPELHKMDERALKLLDPLRDLTNPEVRKNSGNAAHAKTTLLKIENALENTAGIDGLQIYRGQFHILMDEPDLALQAFDIACERQAYRNGPAMIKTLTPLLVTAAFIGDKRLLNKWGGWAEALGLKLELNRPDALFYKMFPPENYYVETDISKHLSAQKMSINANLISTEEWENRAPDLHNPDRRVKGYGRGPKPQIAIFAHSKQPEKVKLLLEAGANPNAVCSNDGSALLNAVQAGCIDSFTLLLPLTDLHVINLRTKQTGKTCLGEAVSRGDINMVRALLECRATADLRGEMDATPLRHAVCSIMENAPAELLEQSIVNQATLNALPPWMQPSASPFLADRLNATDAQHRRDIAKHPEIWKNQVQWVRTGAGASLDDRLAILRELLAAGADPNAKHAGGLTPFLCACKLGNEAVIEMLR